MGWYRSAAGISPTHNKHRCGFYFIELTSTKYSDQNMLIDMTIERSSL